MTSSILTTIQIVFIILKLTNLVTWSWWLVLLPTLIPLAVGLLILLLTGLAVVATVISGK